MSERKLLEGVKIVELATFIAVPSATRMPEVERRIRDTLHIPTVTFDGDQADPRVFSEAQYQTRIEALCEVMAANKEAKA